MIVNKFLRITQLSALFYFSAIVLFVPYLLAQSHHITNNTGPNIPCRFEPEYYRIKSDKTDPRVAYIEITPKMKIGGDFSVHELCLDIAQQTEDAHVIFDRKHGFFHVFYDGPSTGDAIAYFAGTNKSPGIMLYVTRFLDDWQTGVFAYRNNKWENVTAQYLGPFHLGKKDYIIVPQYGRSARVLTYDGKQFHHKMWLTWDGTKFTASTAKKMPGWRCPDSYRYFDSSERRQYCQ
jgi:hypothetical protein